MGAADQEAMMDTLVDQARALDALGYAEWLAGYDERAHDYFEEGLELLRSGGYPMNEAEMLLRIGNLYLSRRKPVEAKALMGRALARYRELGAPEGAIDALQALARVASDGHAYDEASALLSDALVVARAIGVPGTEATVLADLASVESDRGRPTAARAKLDMAIRIARRSDDKHQEADLVGRKADDALRRHRRGDARRLYERARALNREVRRAAGEASALLGLNHVAQERGDFDEAARMGEEALALAEKIHDRDLTRTAMVALSVTYSDLGRHADAAEMLEAVVRLDPNDAGVLVDLGWILYQAGEFKRSISESTRALEIDPTQTHALRVLGHAYLALGRSDEADGLYWRAIDDRNEGEDFVGTIKVLRKLRKQHPELPRVKEFLDRFIEAQARIVAQVG
ncbi:MAG: tetratricopeptide repeat protein [Chloroflexota bacterium]